jgi:hypothetical protein
MKSDSSFLNFILGVILLLLLAVAAKAQTKNSSPSPAKNSSPVKKKKTVSAEEAKVLYEEKNGRNNSKRKSYSRKDIEESIPAETTALTNTNTNTVYSSATPLKTETNTTIQPVNQPKAIYKGPTSKETVPEDSFYVYKPKPAAIKFLEHIELEIKPGKKE